MIFALFYGYISMLLFGMIGHITNTPALFTPYFLHVGVWALLILLVWVIKTVAKS